MVIGVPFYGRIWSSDGTFNGNGVSLNTIQTLIQQYNGTITYDTSSRSPKAQFTVNAGDTLLSIGGKRLTPGSYTVWFEDETSIYEKTRLIHQYDLKGMGSLVTHTGYRWNPNKTDRVADRIKYYTNTADTRHRDCNGKLFTCAQIPHHRQRKRSLIIKKMTPSRSLEKAEAFMKFKWQTVKSDM